MAMRTRAMTGGWLTCSRSGTKLVTLCGGRVPLARETAGCSAVVNGTSGSAADGVVAVTYANKTGQLKILVHGGTLHWYHVKGCAGLVHNGDTATLSATFAVSPQQDITSP